MFNTNNFNENIFNGDDLLFGASGGTDGTTTIASFGGYPLNNTFTTINNIMGIDSGPIRILNQTDRPRSDGTIKTSDNNSRKMVMINGYIKADTVLQMGQRLVELKRAIGKKDQQLIINLDEHIQVFPTANLQNLDQCFEGRLSTLRTKTPFSFQFITTGSPYGEDFNYSAIDSLGTTAGTFIDTVETFGSAPTFLIYNILFNSANTVSELLVTNNTNGQQIKITETIIAGDRIIIDGEFKTVKLNGAIIDYEGEFPEIEAGINNIETDITSTSHNVDITYKYKNRYL